MRFPDLTGLLPFIFGIGIATGVAIGLILYPFLRWLWSVAKPFIHQLTQ